MKTNKYPIDLLVLGAGMAGLSAAAKAVQDGAQVLLVEKVNIVGGSANYAGFIWTAPNEKVMQQVNPDAIPELAGKVSNDYQDAISWVKSLGVDVQEPVNVLGFGKGRKTDVAAYIQACQRIVREGGELLLETTPTQLLIEDGAVIGAEVITADGERRQVLSRTTLLATGGFGGDAQLRAELIHPLAKDLPLRANPNSCGDGLRFGKSAGAAVGKKNAGFYGHLIPSQVAFDDPMDFVTLSFYHSEHSVLLNLEGKRFCDETIGDHISTMEVMDQPEARALMIYDQRVHDECMMKPYVEGAEVEDRFQVAYKRGARCAVADNVDDFAALPEEWGYSGESVVAALKEYNNSCVSGVQNPPRALEQEPLLKAPFYVIEVIPAITFTFEGLLINTRAQVIDERGTPIPGLLAAGADSGGVYVRAYAGGLANALVYGLQAAQTALSK